MTPLLAAAVTGHTHIVEYIVHQLDTVGRREKIDALELLGATFVDRKRDMLGALQYWKQAMDFRCPSNSSISKKNNSSIQSDVFRYENGTTAFPKPQGQSPIAAFENTVEAASQEQLDEAVSDPDEMRMQALLVRERILGTQILHKSKESPRILTKKMTNGFVCIQQVLRILKRRITSATAAQFMQIRATSLAASACGCTLWKCSNPCWSRLVR